MFSLFKRSHTDLQAVLQRLDTLESNFRTLHLEWTEAYDKILHALDRHKKRLSKQLDTENPDNGDRPAVPDLLAQARAKGLIR